MANTCTVCKRSYSQEVCPYCTVTDVKVSDLTDKLHLQHGGDGNELPTAFLVDLVSNRKIPITTPRCKVGRDDLNDIVISGDQSISRFHFVISKDADQYMVQDSKSRHGTFLNGNQIAGPIPINDGDVLKVGVSLFWFVIENQAGGSSPDFSPVDIETIDAQEMKVSANEKTTPYAPTKETDLSTMTSLKEVLAQAKVKEGGSNEEEMSMTIAPKDAMKAEDKAADKSGKSDANQEKSSEKSDEKADPKDKDKDKESKSSKDESERKDESSEKKEDGLQITASMLLEALGHESPIVVSKLDDKPEEADSKDKDKSKKNKKDEDRPSEMDLQGLFAGESAGDNGNLDKTSSDKEASGKNNKDQEGSTSDKITGSSADKAPEDKPGEENSKVESKGNDEDFSPGQSDKPESDQESVSKSTLDKMSDAVQEKDSSESKDKEPNSKDDKSDEDKSAGEFNDSKLISDLSSESTAANKQFEEEIVEKTKNGAWSGNTMQDTKVPDWCSKYFASELNLLVKDLDHLNEQVRSAQNKIKEVENRLAATKSLRNTLLTATGEDLVEACGKVLARLGWRVKIVEDDKQELRLEADDKISICRIIWTPGLPERTHLGQLSIAQTRFWCEQGAEPKGILIAAQAEDKPPPKITDSDYSGELADYASKKNVLMFTTLQLLAMYKEVALNDGSAESLRSSIHTSNGWLKGYSLDPSDEDEKEPGKLASASA